MVQGIRIQTACNSVRRLASLKSLRLVMILVTSSPMKRHSSKWLRADSRLAPSHWETSLQSNADSRWLGANRESALTANEISRVIKQASFWAWFQPMRDDVTMRPYPERPLIKACGWLIHDNNLVVFSYRLPCFQLKRAPPESVNLSLNPFQSPLAVKYSTLPLSYLRLASRSCDSNFA